MKSAPAPLRIDPPLPLIVGGACKAREGNLFDLWAPLKPFRNRFRILNMTLHPEAKGLHTYQRVMGSLRIHCGPEIPKCNRRRVQGVGLGPKSLMKLEPVIGCLGL